MLCYTQDDANADGGMYYAMNSISSVRKTTKKKRNKFFDSKMFYLFGLLIFFLIIVKFKY